MAARAVSGSVSATAVVLAGGTGSRFGADLPKQLLEIDGRTVLEHTLRAFVASPRIARLVLVMHPDHLDAGRRVADLTEGAVELVAGGATRAASVRNAVAHLCDLAPDARVLVHDAARPVIGADVIARCVDGLAEWSALTTVADAVDTLLEVAEDGHSVGGVIDRSRVRLVQTPQGFHHGVLAEAHRLAAAAGDDDPSDDAQLVLRYLRQTRIGLVAGDRRNIKVTHAGDLAVAAHLLDTSDEPNPRGRRP